MKRFGYSILNDILHYPWKYNEYSKELKSTYDDICADEFVHLITHFPYHEYALCSLFRKNDNIPLDGYRTVEQEKQILKMMLFMIKNLRFKHTSLRKGIHKYIGKTLKKYKSYMRNHYDISEMFHEFLKENNINITYDDIKNTYIEYCVDIRKLCYKEMTIEEFTKKYRI